MERDQDGSDVRWMTYPEAAEALGVEAKSIQRRAARSGWTRRRGNDGRQRVGVPLRVLREAEGKKTDNRGDIRSDDRPDNKGLVEFLTAQLEEAKAALRVQEAALTDSARQAAEAREEAARLRGELDGIKLGLEHSHEHLAQARREAIKATEEVQERRARAEALEKQLVEAQGTLERLQARGFLARLLNRKPKMSGE